MSFPDPSPRLGDSDNNLLFKIAQMLSDSLGGVGITQAQVDFSIAAAIAADNALDDAKYVNVPGDTMTGALAINTGTVVASAPPFSLSQTWNGAGVVFSALGIAITNTASAAGSTLFDAQVDSISRFRVGRTSSVTIHRQEADTAGTTFTFSKRGTTGDATAAIANASNIASVDGLGWDGTTLATVATLRLVANEVFTSTGHGCQWVWAVPSIGATTVTTRLTLSALSLNLTNGCAYNLNNAPLLNPLRVFAAGTAYTLTAASAGLDFGTTDPILTINVAGTYQLMATVQVELVGATFAANRTLTVKVRRTNNTPGDVAQSLVTYTVPITSALTQTLAVFDLPEVAYTTANTTDTLQLFADISALPSAGSITISAASITVIRTS